MLAVVENQQQLAFFQILEKHLERRDTFGLIDAEHREQDADHERFVEDGSKVDEPGSVLPIVERRCGRLERKTRLSHAAGANDRDEGFGFQKPLYPKNVLLPSDETRRLQRKIVGRRFERAQGLELRAQPGADRLKDAFGLL